ncbi:MAG TPA: DUF1801 domain-containing protein, partial [Burkholderiaceae bacterium]|nr:DUF1801 domain-containing protein [Burkholderiaceae bacterium]
MTATTLRTDPRIDAYIEKAPAFAQPILVHLRAAVHRACPDVEETIKWSRPHFLLDGQMFAGMSAFKAHCAFGFWHREGGAVASLPAPNEPAMGHFGRIESVGDLPKVVALRQLIEQAALEARAIRQARETGAVPPKPRPRR